jgi:Na+/H+-dicarboxylate symporter
MSTDKAMILAVVTGLLMSLFPKENRFKEALFSGISFLSRMIGFFLHRIFIPCLPIYVFGFCLKLSYEKALIHLFNAYGKVFLLSLLLVMSYILLLYVIGAAGNLKLVWSRIKSMAPAGLTGFSTMSSAATMPVTLKCTHEVTQDRHLTDLVIPTTSNIHMLGDDLTIVMAAMALMTMLGMPMPDLMTFTFFVGAFCVAKLSCVGIPGASVLVVLPVLQNYLEFSPEMVTVMTTIYILQDSFGTCANVMGNGAFALIIQRLTKMSWKAPEKVPVVE